MQLLKIPNKAALFLIFFAGCLLYTSSIGHYPISFLDEAKNAEAAREMFSEGHAFYPTFNGILRTDKPPLHYLFMQLAFALFGVGAFAARFFSGVLGGLLLVLLFYYVQKFTGRKVASWATFILASSLFWTQEFHMAVPDPYLLFFLTLSWLAFYDFFKNRKLWSLWIFYLSIAFALLSKGPVVLLLSGAIAILWLAVKHQLFKKTVWSYQPIFGVLIITLISAPWFIWMHLETQGAYTRGFFLSHNLSRFTSEMEGHGGSFLLTWLFVIIGVFPFGVFLPQAIVAFFKMKRKHKEFYEYSAIVASVVVVFFSISSTRLPNYTLPAIPFLAVFIAHFFQVFTQQNYHLANYISFGIVILLTLFIPTAIFIVFHQFYDTFCSWYLIFLSVISLVGSITVLYYLVKKKHNIALLSTGLLWIVIGLYTFYFLYPYFFEQKELKTLQAVLQNKEVKVYKSFEPALAFQLQRTFSYMENDSIATEFSQNPQILLLSKDKFFQKDSFMDQYDVLWEKQTLFEDYKSIVLRKKQH